MAEIKMLSSFSVTVKGGFANFYVDRSTMPKEQGRFWEGTPRCSSKTAKNKSNSATLQAALGSIHRDQSGMGDRNKHMVLCDGEKDSEKDSGYSGNHMSVFTHARPVCLILRVGLWLLAMWLKDEWLSFLFSLLFTPIMQTSTTFMFYLTAVEITNYSW